MRILHTSDWHVGRRMRGRDRSAEHRDVLAEIVGLAEELRVDLTVVAGDLFDTGSPTAVAEQIVWRALTDLSAISPVLLVAGNHDNPGRLDAVAPLLEMGRVTAVGVARSADSGGVVHLDHLGARVALLPFVSQRGIVKAEQIMGQDPDQNAGSYEERLRHVIEALTGGMTTDTVNLLVTHLTVHGALRGGGEREAHIFGYAVPASIFPGHLSYVALGHYHRQQRISHPAAIWYSGSPLQLDFSEEGDRKGLLMVDAEPGRPAKVTEVPLTSGRRLLTLTGTLDEVIALADDVGDAYVKVELRESARVGLADEVRATIPGVVDVILAAPPLGEADDGPDPIRQMTRHEAFHRYLEEKGVDDRAVEDLFAELLAEVET